MTPIFGTAYDSDNQLAVGDVTGDGAEDIIIAKTEGGSRMGVADRHHRADRVRRRDDR